MNHYYTFHARWLSEWSSLVCYDDTRLPYITITTNPTRPTSPTNPAYPANPQGSVMGDDVSNVKPLPTDKCRSYFRDCVAGLEYVPLLTPLTLLTLLTLLILLTLLTLLILLTLLTLLTLPSHYTALRSTTHNQRTFLLGTCTYTT
jgi:hypothetical protein